MVIGNCHLLLLDLHSQAIDKPNFTGLIVGAAIGAFIASLLIWMLTKKDRKKLRGQLAMAVRKQAQMRQLIDTITQITRKMPEAQNENELMDTALAEVAKLAGAIASSYAFVDERGQPLPAFTYGPFPSEVLQSWADHLAMPETRRQCSKCQLMQADPGGICPSMQGLIDQSLSVYCFPVYQGEHYTGVLHLYFAAGIDFPEEYRNSINELVHQLSSALHNTRLRNQELTTLRQLQLARIPKNELSELLTIVIEGFQNSLDINCCQLYVLPGVWGKENEILVGRGCSDCACAEELRMLGIQAINEKQNLGLTPVKDSGAYSTRRFALPIILPDGQVAGAVMGDCKSQRSFSAIEMEGFNRVINQAARLIDSSQMIFRLQYEAVMQERSRLAREIHDGLAQTLAYLKLQTAQMRASMEIGNQDRLGELITQNQQALSAAYLDVRQVIDNLSVTASRGFYIWLEEISKNFEQTSNLELTRSFEAVEFNLMPEVEAQLIRIIQEALTNIRKHAKARQVFLCVRKSENNLVLEIIDDGEGFSSTDLPLVSRHGLAGMRERADLIGADFLVSSQPDQGTTIQLSIPLLSQEIHS